MNPRSMAPTLLRGSGWVALWSLIGLAIASEIYLSSNFLGRSITWGEAISDSLEDWYVYGVLSVGVVWLTRRWPPERGSRIVAAAVHLAGALVFSLVYIVVRSVVGVADGWTTGQPASFADLFHPLLVRTFPFNLLVYGAILTVSHALDYYRKYHERTVQTLELEKHLTEARLQALLHQLKPHFLFNTLNGIASLMHTDVDAADTMLVRLSELLRITMSRTGAPQTTLREEVAFLERYLDIEKIRFRSRLEVLIAVDPAVIEAQVPSLILQPMVENAMHHGIEPHARKGRIEIRGARSGGQLVLTVADNGAGMPAGGFTREGIGVANTRARLDELYGPKQKFEMVNRPEGGLCVTITIPFTPPPPSPNPLMTKLRILVADDEPLARARLLSLLPKDVEFEITGEYASGTEAAEAIRRDRPDIAFLDMQMPGCDGLQVVAGLPEDARPAVVFVTAHDKFAVDAFGVRAVDYVLKPFDRERLETALERAAEYVSARKAGNLNARLEEVLSTAGAPKAPRLERLAVKADGRFVFLRFDEIVWVEAADNYVVIHTTAGERLMPRDTLSAIEERLGPQMFTRVNRSAVVRIDQVKELQPNAQGDYTVLLRNGVRVPLSRNLRGRFEKFLMEG